jgi:hypothetical protein
MLTLFLGSPFEVFNVSLEPLRARKVFLVLFFDVVKFPQKGCFSGNLTFNKLLVIIVRNRRYLLLKTVHFFIGLHFYIRTL